MSWSDERIELLKKLWAEGLSARQIADQLGGITRNAVIGKVHRLGLSGRCATSASASVRTAKKRVETKLKVVAGDKPRVARSPVAETVASEKRTPQLEVFVNPYVEPVEELEIPEGERVTMEALSDGQCKWPIGDPLSAEFHFCGRHQHGESVYCEFHHAKAYQPARRSVRKKEQPRLISRY